MNNICDNSACTGCMACMNVCTHHAIELKIDDEGFERPAINDDLCVDCGLCSKVCPINKLPQLNEAKVAFSGWSSHESVRIGSSSGGAFTEIARPILKRGGVVFGCALNENLKAEHVYVETMEELEEKLRGSKYVQSHIGVSYKQAKAFLKQGRQVLFSGTPCQIAGLRNYLRHDYNNLFTIDLVCHGVPSPVIFERYKEYVQQHENMKLTKVNFRCKKSSWIFFNMTLQGHVEKSGALKTYIGRYYNDPYLRGFLRDYFLRPSCYQCRFTSVQRSSDFTIADWWGYNKISSKDKDFRKKGVSLVLANTAKAVELMSTLDMSLRSRTMEEAKLTNVSLSRPFAMTDVRAKFWNDYRKLSFKELVNKYMQPESVSWDIDLMQRLPNTDVVIFLIRLMRFIRRIIDKITLFTQIKH